MTLPGLWEFPGGKVELGESPQESLARELREELKLQATIGSYLTTTVHEYDFATVSLSTYFAYPGAAEPVLLEHADARWLSVSELYEVEWAPADIPAVRMLAEMKSWDAGVRDGA